MSAPHIALNRFGLGARPGEASGLGDPRGWLEDQLEGDPPDRAAAVPSDQAVAEAFRGFLTAVRSQDRDGVRAATRKVIEFHARESAAALATRAASERPFVERWIAFWSNHLCVSVGAGIRVAAFAGRYEREAIRPHVLGPFEKLLLASARHPAMLLYLDNAQSVGPESRVARRPRRGRSGPGQDRLRGLNENYARELLELHTLGVGGGYSQDDVRELARILTGWTVAGLGGPVDRLLGGGSGGMGGRGGPPGRGGQPAPGGPGGVPREADGAPTTDGIPTFHFLEWAHEPGRKTMLGRRYDEGESAGRAVIRDLARRPEAARFISTKLVTHFIDDAPPPRAVDRLTARWMETEGDLREVARELVALDEAWEPRYRKFRTPQDWMLAILRAVGNDDANPAVTRVLRQLRHPLWAPPSPAGYSDLNRDWGDPDSLMNRAELARTLAERTGRDGLGGSGGGPGAGRSSNPGTGQSAGAGGRDLRPLGTVMPLEPDDPLGAILADTSLDASERIALAFAGPAFQWR
jgi:uncharacterized protein (DUF1800 family)